MAPRWELVLSLDGESDRVPLFARIARAVVTAVRHGRLRPGARLPSSRALARSLGVARNTVLFAYGDLEAQGWIGTAPTRGTFVSEALPEPPPRATASAQRSAEPGFPLRPAPPPYRAAERHRPGTLVMAGGVPDARLAPAADLGRAYRRAVRAPVLLGYGDPRGERRLRRAIAELCSLARGLDVDAEGVLVTRGSQMALYLVARALCAPGDVVVVEDPGYRPAWEAFRMAGARLVPLAVDAEGARVERLEAIVAREPVRAVYLTPHHQYPTTATLAAGRRLALLALARRARIAVVEDDYDHEFHYEGRPVLPLASADEHGLVVYVGTLSKVIAPGLRLGYVVAPAALAARLAALRAVVDLQGDPGLERAVAELFEDGVAERHIRRARRIYRARRDLLATELARHLGGALAFEVPNGGMALWARVDRGVDIAAWQRHGAGRGVAFQAGARFSFDGRLLARLRLGFAALDEGELREAVRRMARALADARTLRPQGKKSPFWAKASKM
jgi:GntR family transcriptional regulator/MocR family aminotransferase